MKDASQLLFDTPIAGKILYKKQLDLVNDLLNEPECFYYTDPSDKETYNKHQIRLKTLISQLLSPNVCRNIPTPFPGALKTVLSKKILDPAITEQIVNDIIEDLKQKNDLSTKNDSKQEPILDRLIGDFKLGSYIAIVTANPLEIEAEPTYDTFSIRQIFVQDFLENINASNIVLKKYRLLFSLESSCFLFWKGLKEIVFRFIKAQKNNEVLIRNLKTKFGTTSSNQSDLFDSEVLTDDYVNDLTIRLLTFLNNEGFLVVFWHTSPLFSLPLIAINPAEFKNAKIYTLLDSDKNLPFIHKYSPEETILWRLFVWDKLKSKQYSGKKIDFTDSLNYNSEY